MSRISLVEAYDNRDVIGQLVRLREDVNELQNILKDIDPDGDLTNVVTKTGDQTIDGIKTFIGKIVADCDIIQNGAAYETHAEQVYSVNDYIVTRDGQIAGLGPGELSGFHVKKYNGVDDSRLGVDSSGTMRVGDVGSEQPLMTRDEVADLTSGNILLWDGVNEKAITSNKSVSDISGDIAAVDAAKVSGSGNIGSDVRPVKVVDGVATEVTADLQQKLTVESHTTGEPTVTYITYGNVVVISVYALSVTNGVNISVTGVPRSVKYVGSALFGANATGWSGGIEINAGTTTATIIPKITGLVYGSLVYVTS